MNSRRIVVTISDFSHPKPSRPGWGNAIKHRVDGVRHIGAAIRCEGGVVQEGLACAETVIQFRNETTVFSVVDKDQAGLPPYYHERSRNVCRMAADTVGVSLARCCQQLK